MNLTNRVVFDVAGQRFTVNTDEDCDKIKGLADILDRRIMNIMKKGNHISPFEAAVIAAMEIEDNNVELSEEISSLKNRLRESLEDAASAKSERDALRRELNKYTAKNEKIQDKNLDKYNRPNYNEKFNNGEPKNEKNVLKGDDNTVSSLTKKDANGKNGQKFEKR